MKKLLVLILLFIFMLNPVYGHKLISHDGSHLNFDSALEIPDHKISWAIYDNLKPNQAKYYSFDAKHGDSFYTSIVIPKIAGLENYSPTLFLVGFGVFENDPVPFETDMGTKKISYTGDFPGKEFYEPFGQVTYWERQEVKTTLPVDGEYFIVVVDENNKEGKYSLAVGVIEDFSGADFFTILPKAWFDTKIFVNDYASIGILFGFLVFVPIAICFAILRKKRLQNYPSN